MTGLREIKVGDVVRLNSGSPKMSVTSIEERSGKVNVVWLNENTGVFTAKLPAECVKIVEER